MYIFLVFKLYTQYETILYLYIVSIVVQRIQDIHIISRITHMYACKYIYIYTYTTIHIFKHVLFGKYVENTMHVNFHSAQLIIFHSAKLLIVVCSATQQRKSVVGQPR